MKRKSIGTDVDKKNVFNLELFFELSPDLLCIAGYDGYFKKINQTVADTLGYSKEELMSRPINSFVHADDQEITARNRDGLRENFPLLNFENRYITKNGEVVWLSWTSMPFDAEKVIFAIAKNITHKRKVEDDRNALLTSLTKINDDLKRLTFTTSHDLRSPVSNLLAIFSLMDLSRIRDKETLEYIEMIKLAAETLKTTLNTYVDVLSQKDILNVSIEELDLNKCLNKVLRSLGSLIKGSNAKIHADFSAFDKIRFNQAYLESIFLNLITNSIKYAKAATDPVIRIKTQLQGGTRQLIFSDEGRGFDMEKVKGRIFGLNQKFHEHTDSKGIGLYLVYNHIASLGGSISVESQVDQGAKFVISLRD